MGFYVESSVVVIIVSVGLCLMVKRNLRERPMARRFRATFSRLAEQLIENPEFPDAHAKRLTEAVGLPEGWLTRFMVFKLFQEMLLGKSGKSANALPIDKVPEHLRGKYVAALFALAIGDSYRSALLGRVWRGANPWVLDAVKHPKQDINAHATKRVIEQVSSATQRHSRFAHLEECAA